MSDFTAQPLALEDEISSGLNDPSSSYWFRNALSSALKRDPMDAARDAAVLAFILERRRMHSSSLKCHILMACVKKVCQANSAG